MRPEQNLMAVISMKLKFAAAVAFLLSIFIVCSGLAYADELKGTVGSLNALNSGYAITRWPPSGGIVLVGENLTVRACTTYPPHPEATKVLFRWIQPDGNYTDVGPKTLTNSSDTWGGLWIFDANDSHTLDMWGDWGVQALFMDDEGKLKGPTDPFSIVEIKAISGHAIPEVPFGTIATIVAMIGALSVFAIKKKVLAS